MEKTFIRSSLVLLLTLAAASPQVPVPRMGSQTTHGTYWVGSARIRNHSLKIGIEPGYLDVLEDVEIGAEKSIWGQEPTGDRNTLEVTGLFFLPSGAAVVGLLIWDGDAILKGKLKPSDVANRQYEDVVDRNTSPPPRPRDPFFIRQIGKNQSYETYEYKIYPVAWQAFRKIRVRYLLPRDAASQGSGLYLPAPLFYSASNEGGFQCELSSRAGFNRIRYDEGNDSGFHELPARMSLEYDYSKRRGIDPFPELPSQWLRTSVPDGEWEGHYLQFRAPIPRQALEDAGLIRETVILWKWNHPESFFKRNGERLDPTSWGQEVKAQANRLLQVADYAWENEGEVGLVLHSGDRHRPGVFAMGTKLASEGRRIRNVFRSIVSDDYWQELENRTSRPNDPELNRPTEAQNGVIGFHLAIRAAVSLFSPKTGRIRTILFVTAGPRYAGDGPLVDSLDPGFPKGVFLSSIPLGDNRMEWPGVDLAAFLAGSGRQPGPTDPRTGLPMAGIDSITLRFRAGPSDFVRRIAVPRYGPQPRFLQFDGHAMDPWEPEMRLELSSSEGRTASSYKFAPFHSDRDTNLIKLWSKSPIRQSGKFSESDLGTIFGVVDQSNSLLALPDDVAPAGSEAEIRAGGIPHLLPEEIFAPPKSDPTLSIGARSPLKSIRISLKGGWVEIRMPLFRQARFRLATLTGRLVLSQELRPGNAPYRFKLPSSVGKAGLVLILELDGKSKKFLLSEGKIAQ